MARGRRAVGPMTVQDKGPSSIFAWNTAQRVPMKGSVIVASQLFNTLTCLLPWDVTVVMWAPEPPSTGGATCVTQQARVLTWVLERETETWWLSCGDKGDWL